MSFEHIFNELEIEAAPFALCELRGRCDLGLGRRALPTLHYVLAGQGEIVVRGQAPIQVGPGTLVLVPATQSHMLRSFGHGGPPLPYCHPAELNLLHHLGGSAVEAPESKLLAVCSEVKVGLRGVGDLIDLVRAVIVEQVRAGSAMSGPVDRLLQELSTPKLGSRAMIRVLLMQCMIQLLRNRLEARDRGLVWMAALIDEKLWASLRLMLDAPGDSHSVESLAEVAGMSRSTFAKRFSDAYGSGPMEMLRSLRVHRAAAFLVESDLPVKRIAELVGFHSRTAFTRAFERAVGTSPGSFRSESRRA